MSTMNIGTEKFSIRMEPSGVEVRCGSEQTVLDAAIRSGMSVPYGCRHGNCSSCKAKVVDGDYELMNRVSEFALMEFERQEGYILMCSTMPRSDMIMEVEEDEEPGLQLFPVRDFSGEVVSNERVTPDSADVVSGSGPFGRMQLRSLDNDIVFVAGGSGLAPIKALLESAFAQGFTRQAWLFYGARTTKDLYLTEHWFDWETRSS
ncbi:2Fe-2S iron-sulfur cluster-binding protein [Alicyclobacillus fastidiosus]|uniref:2Fe-2S iron-sulfur cluster-binding protein n=1 Tax=Alicyclobacillus fastidiosus TaxID=392011 RepID=A0ABY6ZC36_9BACL|nr:2Fe-2S iron-sulfur cluster-binding protein [Alicyclobacillus fastidiosus]WAH39816.1 2Fe-2S iron-sulfur cluster-binding protein [Alicyclobacillus fastidiosus]